MSGCWGEAGVAPELIGNLNKVKHWGNRKLLGEFLEFLGTLLNSCIKPSSAREAWGDLSARLLRSLGRDDLGGGRGPNLIPKPNRIWRSAVTIFLSRDLCKSLNSSISAGWMKSFWRPTFHTASTPGPLSSCRYRDSDLRISSTSQENMSKFLNFVDISSYPGSSLKPMNPVVQHFPHFLGRAHDQMSREVFPVVSPDPGGR